jgi:hypothetical protein
MATRKNKLTTVFDGDDKPFQKKIKRVQGSVKKTTGMLKGMGMAIGVAGIVAGISRTIQHFDRIDKIATRLGMSAESLQRLGHAANLSGSNMEQLQGIMTRLERRTGEALQNTTGSQAKRFKELNIEVEAFSNLNPEDKILAIADAFNALGGTEKSIASLMGLLDTEVRELLPLLKEGSDGIKKMMNDISALTDEETKSMAQAANNIEIFKQKTTTILGHTLGGIFNLPKTLSAGVELLTNKNLAWPEWRTKRDYDSFAYGSLLRTDAERALMREHGTGQLDVAQNREAYKKRETSQRQARLKSYADKIPEIRTFEEIMRARDFDGMRFFGKGGGTVGSWGRQIEKPYAKSLSQFDFMNALTGGKSYTPSVVGSKALETHDILQALMGGDTGAMAKATSATSGRFGEFVAAATLGSGQGRMVSQRRGIRIEGIDKQTRILEELKKHLDELAGNTTP